MSEKPLLLSAAKSGITIEAPSSRVPWLRGIATAVGVLVIIVGAADVTNKVAGIILTSEGIFTAFAPAITIIDPTALSKVRSAGATTTPLVPARLKIASLGINAKVVPVKNKSDGSMDTPKKFDEIGWYALGPKAGASGNAVFAGHVNNALTMAGVFAHLVEIKQGDTVEIIDSQGKSLSYRVVEVANYKESEAPLDIIFAKQGPPGVVLITCDGPWNTGEGSFERRLVVFAKPILE